MTNQDRAAEHPGDAYARAEIEAWYARHLRSADRNLADAAAGAVAALGGKGSRAEAKQRLRWAQQEMDEYENGYQEWTEQGTMPWRHSQTVSRVIGSIQGGLAAAFGPPITLTAGEEAAMAAGLDPAMEPDGQLAAAFAAALGAPMDSSRPPTPYELADREYKARWSVGFEAMGRMGLYREGDPPTTEMRAENALQDARDNAERVRRGEEPWWPDVIVAETRAALGEPVDVQQVIRDQPRMPDLDASEEEVRRFCMAAHERLIGAATEVDLMVADLRTKIEQIKGAEVGGIGSKVKARIVLAHLTAAARLLETAAVHSKKTVAEYRKQFGPDEPQAQTRRRDKEEGSA
jgi:hypothetical protein